MFKSESVKRADVSNFAVNPKNYIQMKKMITPAVLFLMLPLMLGCREEAARTNRTQFSIERSMQHDVHRKIQFSTIKERDEKTAAMDLAADRWSRNMYVQDSHASLRDYVEKYGQNP